MSILLTFSSCSKETKGIYAVYKNKDGYNQMMSLYKDYMAKWTIPYKELNVKTSWGTTHVIKAGQKNKKPLIVLHGGGTNQSLMFAYIDRMTKNHLVYAIDIIGEPGKSIPLKLFKEPKDLAQWLNEVLIDLKIEKADFYGVSFGAFTSQWFLNYYPHKVDKMVNISYTYMDQSFNFSSILKIVYYSIRGDRENIQKMIILMNNGPIKNKAYDELFTDFMIKKIKHTNVNTINVYNSVPPSSVKKIKNKVLIIMGEKDCLFNAQKAKMFLKKVNNPNITYIILKNQGHIPSDNSEKIDAMTSRFFRE